MAARDEAGTFLNSGDFAGGMAIVDCAIVEAESTLEGRDRAFGLGILHLRGLSLAGRLKDEAAAGEHIRAAWRTAEEYGGDADEHGIHLGPDQTATHVISTYSDMDQHRRALDTADDLIREGTSLRTGKGDQRVPGEMGPVEAVASPTTNPNAHTRSPSSQIANAHRAVPPADARDAFQRTPHALSPLIGLAVVLPSDQ
ncbi:hypothetical protein [Streptomyces cadmiisoli]|uniref:hypothetical protein n=1 Tax=Streptomyces cadmiisoli TaxID=2184053 RepID=UPI003664D549